MPSQYKPASEELERQRRAKADLLELELAEKRGELVPADTASQHVQEVLEGVKQRLLWVPTQLNDPEVSMKVRALIIEALERIQTDDPTN